MAVLTTTQSFSDGDTVTAAKLNNIIANTTIDDDAVTTRTIKDDAVELAQMADDSVDTGQLVDDAVQNAKLENMANQTVKANATTTGAANPTDVEIAADKLLVGTSDSLKGVTFTSDLELDAADDAATLIRAADTLISGKSTVTVVPANDTVLVYDADGSGNKLGKATVTSMMQSLPAVESTSGVVRLATTKRSVDPTTAGTVAADTLTVNNASPMLAKAWIEFTSTGSAGVQSLTNSFNITSITQSGTGIYDIVFGNGGTGTKFDLPSDNYMLIATGATLYGDDYQLFGRITSRTSTGVGCTVKFGAYSNITVLRDPDVVASLVFFGLTS